MGITNLGAVSMSAGGVYNPETVYKKYKVVSANGGSYMYINSTPAAGVPVTNTSHWQQIASRGLKGDPFEYEDFTPEQLEGLVGNGIKSIFRTSGDGTPGSVDTYTITFDDDSTTTFLVYNGADGDISNIKVDGATKTKAAGTVDLTSDFARYALWRKTPSGNPVSVYPVPESPLYPKVSGTFTQAGTDDPSPENIRPITPWLANGATAKVKRTGKCVLAHSRDSDTGTVDLPSPVVLKAGVTYRISTINKKNEGNANCALADGSSIDLLKLGWYGFSKTVTPSSDITIYKVSIDRESTTSPAYMWIELGSISTPYEPYIADEISLTAPQEIVAGWMGCEGNGAATGVKATLNGSETWDDANFAASGYFETTLAVAAHATPGLACSHFLPAASAAADSNKAVISGTSLKIYPADAVATDKTAWLAWLGSNPVTITYTLAALVSITPVAAPLPALPQLDRVTPRQNVLTASTGNVELTYAKSPIRESDEIATAIAAL